MASRNQGIKSRNLVHPGVRTGSGAKAINHAGASQIGARQGNHFTNGGADGRMDSRYGGVDLYSTGPGYNKAPYGNAKALDVGGGGPGTGRNVYARGTQGVQGNPASGNPTPAKELWPGWGKR